MRDIRGYQLIVENDLDCFNEVVNCHLDDGFQIMEGERARIEETTEGAIAYRIEMVRYVPDQVMVDPRATTAMNIPTDEHLRRMERLRGEAVEAVEEDMRNEETVQEVPPTAFWTADSPDPFDGDVDDAAEEAGEINDHQLNRLGALRQEFDDEVNEVVGEIPPPTRAPGDAEIRAMEQAQDRVGEVRGGIQIPDTVNRNRPNRALREAAQEMREAQMERAESNVGMMDGGMAEAQAEAPMTNDHPF